MGVFKTNQRWASETEPELGLGIVLRVEDGQVQLRFPAVDETRRYSCETAPLRRVRFQAGDRIRTEDGGELTVNSLIEEDGLITYVCENGKLLESRLSSQISLPGPEERLTKGLFDEPGDFDLRWRSLYLQHRSRLSPARGFAGGRIDLIPHQLYIAREVSSRQAPRVLLSDEVGLGKTIEACLIVHRMLMTGRASRVLVLVPESLVHQWFVEMLRRFNVWLHIFDEERCASIEAGEPGSNPFLDDQLVLASIDFIAGNARRGSEVTGAGWDLLVVDEAHHLDWSPEAVSPAYALVEELARETSGVLLLTATPEQLGLQSHFARLRLLDPERYGDYQSFVNEPDDFRATADLADVIAGGKKLSRKNVAELSRLLAHDEELDVMLKAVGSGNSSARAELLSSLLDLHGPGRVVFRNTRAAMKGFPRRRVSIVALEVPPGERSEWLDRISTEFAVDAGDQTLQVELDLARDPRIAWLAGLLREFEPQKILLICRSLEKVEAIDETLRRHLTVKSAVFHEGLTLIQRDRNAAWFAEEDGARLLICSEIGSEGRNFQFAHHLVLFDLPLHPELLEQRIGRLDRIGQSEDIRIHVPVIKGSPHEVLARWYHDGLDAFETNLEGGDELFKRFGRQVHDLALEFPAAPAEASLAELDELIQASAAARRELRQRLEEGRDRLLELNSFRPDVARKTIEAIQAEDSDATLPEYLLDVFDHFGVHAEELAPLTWQLDGRGVTADAFPALPAEGMIATCDRRRALGREDVGFLTWDHPMVTGAVDLILGSARGNASFGVLPHATERTLLIEMVFVLEVIAAGRLHVDRFLPATPVRVVVNHKPAVVTGPYPPEAFAGKLHKGRPYTLLEKEDIVQRVIPAMLTTGESAARRSADGLVAESLTSMNQLLGHELHRLRTLRAVNDHIRSEEIDLAAREQRELAAAIQGARLRLDCLRMIWKGPAELLR